MDKKEFINSIKEGALKGQSEHGILASLTMAQAILESGWGSSELSRAANNLFGIKAFSDWTGKKITLQTKEWNDGVIQVINADFRAYNCFNESIEDHNKLLSGNRYKPVCGSCDYRIACETIFECGYATDPDYAEKLVDIIQENGLYEFDEYDGNIRGNKLLRFQKLCNLLDIRDGDGNALAEDNILGWKTTSCVCKMPLLIAGSHGAAVGFVQECLAVEPIDGEFGPITKRNVIEFQKKHEIEIDGIVGIQTWTTILIV